MLRHMVVLQNGSRIAIQRSGKRTNETMILLHHGTGCIQSWDNVVSELSDEFDTIAYDRAGFGKSEPSITSWTRDYHKKGAYELLSVMDILDIEKAILVGHSDGATIAMIAGAIEPTRICAGILEAPHVLHGSKYETAYGNDGGFEYFRQHVMIKYKDRIRSAFERDHGSRGEEVLSRWFDWWTCPQNMNWNCTDVLQEIQCPCLCIHGENDVFFPEIHTRMINEHIVNSEMRIIKGAGHEIHKDKKDEWLKITMGWLQQLLPPRWPPGGLI